MTGSSRLATACTTLMATFFCATLAHGHTIAGVVLDAEDAPVAEATVWLSQLRFPHVATTDTDGAFRFEDIQTGPVQIVVRKEGYALGGTDGQCIEDTDIAIRLGTPMQTRLRIINRRYEPIEGARIKSLVVNDRFTVMIEDLVYLGFPSYRSDAEGFLSVPDLPEYGFVSITVADLRYANGMLPALPVGVELDFPLSDGVAVRGRITRMDGARVARARVSVYRPREDARPLVMNEVLSGPEGFYSAIVPPGTYFVAARHPDYAMPTPVAVEIREDGEEVVADLHLPKPHRIRGLALDEKDRPVPLAVFSYRVDTFVLDEAISDANGRFELIAPMGAGVLHIDPPRRMITKVYPRIYFEVTDMPAIELDPIRFRALPEIEGQVSGPDGVALDRILISSLNLDPPVYATTDTEGRFVIRLDEVPEEPIAFRAEHALRFLRDDFKIDPQTLEAPTVKLRAYRPRSGKDSPFPAPNDLGVLADKPAPEIACDAWFNLASGETSLSLEDLKGKVVVLTLWAGHDFEGHTRDRMNELNALYRLLRDIDDVAFIAVHDAGADPARVGDYVKDFGIEYPVGCDADPFLTFKRYGTHVIPQTVLIDKRGVLKEFNVQGRLPELIKRLRRR